MRNRRIILACDYRGVELRDAILTKAKEMGLDIEDIGIQAGSPLDYVDITKSLVEKLHGNPDAYGVLVCGSGQGVAIYANRYNHIRATMCRTPEDAESVRSKLDANVLCLGSKYTPSDKAMECLLTFLDTPFKAERHGRCASKLDTSVTDHTYKGVNLIVRAIVTCDDHILLTKATEQNIEFSLKNYFLPGGHVSHNESAIDALKRELKEETNYDSTSVEFVGALECSWERNSQTYHELNLVYIAEMPKLKLDNPPVSSEPFQEFIWFPLSDISTCKLLPKKLVNMIQESASKNRSLFFSEMKRKEAA